MYSSIIIGHVRELRYQQLNQDGFRDAMRDPTTGLTHAALVGLRRQSVPDAERLLSYHVGRWMSDNGYPFEGEFVEVQF